ncbi:MAG: hypothetical protein NVSMB47_07370 [Polyangiales bacterium]
MTDREPLRLLDPDALDRKREPRGRASIVVPTAWLRDGARLEVDLPPRLRCDLCDGGGCDACARSGGYRLPESRTPLALTLPRVTDDELALRVTNPLADATPAMLVVRVAAGVVPSTGVRWVGPNHDVAPHRAGPPLPQVPAWARTLVLVVLVAIVAAVARVACR